MTTLAARSNAISQRVMKPLEVDVYQAARERMHRAFQEYDQVVVSYSGGKDSTCVLELTVQVAKELGRLPLNVLFCDEEVLLPEAVEMAQRTSQRPEVKLHWVCAPVKYHNACSLEEPWWWPWDSTKRDVWVRQPPEAALWLPEGKHPIPLDVVQRLYGPEYGRVGFVVGLRGYESRPRMYGVLFSGSFISRGPAPHINKVRPIYDWRDRDVWLAIHRGRLGLQPGLRQTLSTAPEPQGA